jgi:hypothetical protein
MRAFVPSQTGPGRAAGAPASLTDLVAVRRQRLARLLGWPGPVGLARTYWAARVGGSGGMGQWISAHTVRSSSDSATDIVWS